MAHLARDVAPATYQVRVHERDTSHGRAVATYGDGKIVAVG